MDAGNRLRKRSEFQKVYREGIKAGGRFVVLFARDDGGAITRLGITASRKTGKAVVRNRARRRVRELFRRHSDRLTGIAADLVVNVRQGCAHAAWNELERDYLECLTRLERRLSRRAP